MIKAIETQYKGYRFRSRLEARWAVFFDELGIKWEYEKEGYQLSNGVRYLPDFWLPNNGLWVEIKGEESEDHYDTLIRFRDDMNQPILLAVGLPSDYNTELLCWDIGDSSGGCCDGYPVIIGAVTYDKQIQFAAAYTDRYRILYADGSFEKIIEVNRLKEKEIVPQVWKSANKAKSSRFEHGETPTPKRTYPVIRDAHGLELEDRPICPHCGREEGYCRDGNCPTIFT